jgi:peptide/nickel transport system permease protein
VGVKILTRVFHATLSVFMLTVLVFGLVRVTGDPATLLLSEFATPADYDRIHAKLGLDQPLPVQYVKFLDQLVHGDLGNSIFINAPVSDLIQQRLEASLILALAALLIVVGVGVPLGIYSAYWRGGVLDRVTRFGAAVAQAAPAFWVALLLILLFSVRLNWLPSGGSGGITHLVLPAFAMSLHGTAGFVRLMRSSMLEVLSSDYIKYTRVRGLRERLVLWKHALRNAALSSLTFVGVLVAGLIAGSVVIETVFVYPGIGALLADSIESRDFPVIQAVVLLISIIYIVVNLCVDVLYVLLDPKLRHP